MSPISAMDSAAYLIKSRVDLPRYSLVSPNVSGQSPLCAEGIVRTVESVPCSFIRLVRRTRSI
jgi:hypothetical protein